MSCWIIVIRYLVLWFGFAVLSSYGNGGVFFFFFFYFFLKILRIIVVRRIWGVDYYLWKKISIFLWRRCYYYQLMNF
jgi:hypothetical protein